MIGEAIVLSRNVADPTYQSSAEVELFVVFHIIIMAMTLGYRILE